MRDNLLLDSVIADETKNSIERVISASAASTFGQLVSIANLDPRRHLRHSDLRDVDFTDTDLTGYDFTGCDLRGARGIRVTWDPNKVLFTDAVLEGSIFAHRVKLKQLLLDEDFSRLHRSIVKGLPWADQVIWAMKSLRPGAKDLDQSRLVAMGLFEHTSDSFVKGECLKYLVNSSTGGADLERFREFLLDIINGYSGDLHLISKSISILAKSPMRGSWRLQGAVEPLLHSQDDRIVALAIQFLAASYQRKIELQELATFSLQRRSRPLRLAFVGALAQRLGPAYELLAREPVSNDYRDPVRRITAEELLLVVRNIRRGFRDEEDAIAEGKRRNSGPIIDAFGKAIHDKTLIEAIVKMYGIFSQFGFSWAEGIAEDVAEYGRSVASGSSRN